MKHTLKIAGVIALEVVIIALLVGLAVGTIWLFHQGMGKGMNIWGWINGICTLSIVIVGLYASINITKKQIRKIQEENK